MSEILDLLKKSKCKCETCEKAFDKIIMLEAQIISLEKMADRMNKMRKNSRGSRAASKVLRSKTASKSARSKAGTALSQAYHG